MFTVSAAKSNFFDRASVLGATDAATRRNLSRFGSFVRQRARSSIKQAPKIDIATGKQLGRGRRKAGVKTRDAISDPGKPPYSHVGWVRQFLYFAYDPQAQSVVIGPTLFGKGTVGALEHGGDITIGPRGRRKGRRVTIGPRPFMQPAFETELGKMPEMFRDTIK